MKVKCNNCMKVFDEEEVVYYSDEASEFCPECGDAGCLMELGDARSAILDVIEQNYNDFMSEMLSKSKEEIFNSVFEIYFFIEMYRFFNDVELDEESYKILLADGKELLANMYRKYLKWDGYSVNTYSDIEEFVADYVLHLTEI